MKMPFFSFATVLRCDASRDGADQRNALSKNVK